MKKYIYRNLRLAGLLLLVLTQLGFAQTALVIGSFENKSATLYLDSWQRSVPETIRSYLSDEKDVQVLDRDKVGTVLREKALRLSGLIETASIDSLDKLSAADFILTGIIDRQDSKIVITADLVRVKTGQVITERVLAADRSFQQQMVAMLVNNILFRLNNSGAYETTKTIPSNAFWYWTASAVTLASGALIGRSVYLDNYKKYHQTDQLQKFDTYYSKANAANKAVITLLIMSAGAATGALVSWVRQKKTHTISAGHVPGVTVIPDVKWDNEKNMLLGLSLHF